MEKFCKKTPTDININDLKTLIDRYSILNQGGVFAMYSQTICFHIV